MEGACLAFAMSVGSPYSNRRAEHMCMMLVGVSICDDRKMWKFSADCFCFLRRVAMSSAVGEDWEEVLEV